MNKRCLSAVLMAGILFAFGQTPVLAQGYYDIIDLGVLAAEGQSNAKDLNAAAQVVGAAKVRGGGGGWNDTAFLWLPQPAYGLPAGMNNLGMPAGGVASHAMGINDLGQVVGWWEDAANIQQAFFWLPQAAYGLPAGINNLGSLGPRSWAEDIDNAGTVVGRSEDSGGWWWSGSGMNPLGPSGVPPDPQSAAYSIDGGIISGNAWEPGLGGSARWFWNGSDYEVDWVGPSGEAYASNETGDVVGAHRQPTGPRHPYYLAADGTLYTYDVFPEYGILYDVNADGLAVGSYDC